MGHIFPHFLQMLIALSHAQVAVNPRFPSLSGCARNSRGFKQILVRAGYTSLHTLYIVLVVILYKSAWPAFNDCTVSVRSVSILSLYTLYTTLVMVLYNSA